MKHFYIAHNTVRAEIFVVVFANDPRENFHMSIYSNDDIEINHSRITAPGPNRMAYTVSKIACLYALYRTEYKRNGIPE